MRKLLLAGATLFAFATTAAAVPPWINKDDAGDPPGAIVGGQCKGPKSTCN